ncbi:response regulator [Aquimarina sp. 2201CG1-2-11]|uniref:response regulator n=1 Tax=Aquimarina discodermiae TaxID=3231043 RepID=UPI00346334B3
MSLTSESVCIIDDDNMYINLLRKIIELKKLSKSVVVFKNGKEAIDFFTKSIETATIPRFIFLDLNMPVMDGWEFLDEFSKIKDKIPKKTLLYVVSSSIDTRDIERAKSIDMVEDYISKPIKIDDFTKILA